MKLDRAGRSLPYVIAPVADLDTGGVGFRSLAKPLDTTRSGGRLMFDIMGALAQFERHLIRDRTHAGLAAARAPGRVGGRKPALAPKKLDMTREMYATRRHTVADIARVVGVSRSNYG